MTNTPETHTQLGQGIKLDFGLSRPPQPAYENFMLQGFSERTRHHFSILRDLAQKYKSNSFSFITDDETHSTPQSMRDREIVVDTISLLAQCQNPNVAECQSPQIYLLCEAFAQEDRSFLDMLFVALSDHKSHQKIFIAVERDLTALSYGRDEWQERYQIAFSNVNQMHEYTQAHHGV